MIRKLSSGGYRLYSRKRIRRQESDATWARSERAARRRRASARSSTSSPAGDPVAARVNANAPGGRGATTGGDPAAWADSIREVIAFFGRYLW